MKRSDLFALTAFFFALLLVVPVYAQVEVYNSGGELMPEQAAFDVKFYDLQLRVDPSEKAISGTLRVEAEVLSPLKTFVLQLDNLLRVEEIYENSREKRSFRHKDGLLYIDLGQEKPTGSKLNISIVYGGKPRVAPNPPWDGGFTWTQTADGQPWIATSCQLIGADVWWPCKDHVSDEPDSMALHIEVPQPLVVASNGVLRKVEQLPSGNRVYHWNILNPINIYNVALNIAPYRLIEGSLESVAGGSFPVMFYVLPEDFEKGQQLFPEILDHLRFFEALLGPYPFRNEKYGVAQTPHLGMEHQTIIAYGAGFKNTSMTRGNDWGFDALHHHELSHEWWGNLVTNKDWKDMWIHEGFGTYMQALYVEQLKGKEGYHRYMKSLLGFKNERAVAPKEITSSKDIYQSPIYAKGAWILHTLRFLVGEEAFFQSLRTMTYPTADAEQRTDGSQVRQVDTEDFVKICEEVSGKELSWFFEVYTYQPKLPTLKHSMLDNQVFLQWESPVNVPFPMPVEVSVNGQLRTVAVPPGGATVKIRAGDEVVIDPSNKILKHLAKQ
jgi:aminopeptidase N